MIGPFGGPLHLDGPGCVESIPPALLAALIEAPSAPPSVVASTSIDFSALTWYRFEAGRGVVYDRDLRGLQPWSPRALPLAEALSALAHVARLLASLHARGVTHGDLRPELLRFDRSAWTPPRARLEP
jgi:hypothetical protein